MYADLQWRAICVHHGVGLVAALLADGMHRGTIPEQPVDPLTHVLVGAVDEAALYVARASDRDRARAEVGTVLPHLAAYIAAD
jgi:hypothetical protein